MKVERLACLRYWTSPFISFTSFLLMSKLIPSSDVSALLPNIWLNKSSGTPLPACVILRPTKIKFVYLLSADLNVWVVARAFAYKKWLLSKQCFTLLAQCTTALRCFERSQNYIHTHTYILLLACLHTGSASDFAYKKWLMSKQCTILTAPCTNQCTTLLRKKPRTNFVFYW